MIKNVDLKTKVADKLEESAISIRNYDLEAKYKEMIEPIKQRSKDHPIQSVLIGVGAGLIVGALICKWQMNQRE